MGRCFECAGCEGGGGGGAGAWKGGVGVDSHGAVNKAKGFTSSPLSLHVPVIRDTLFCVSLGRAAERSIGVLTLHKLTAHPHRRAHEILQGMLTWH